MRAFYLLAMLVGLTAGSAAFELGRVVGTVQCQAPEAAQADRDFLRGAPEHDTGNKRY